MQLSGIKHFQTTPDIKADWILREDQDLKEDIK